MAGKKIVSVLSALLILASAFSAGPLPAISTVIKSM